VLLVLLAGWFGWSAVQQWRQEANGQALEEARDQAVQGLQEAAAGQLKQLQQQLKNERVQQALQAGDAAQRRWPCARAGPASSRSRC
jgi:phosphomannomutase/phosphoglucomutase